MKSNIWLFDRDARRSGPTIYFVVLQGLIKNLLEICVNLKLAGSIWIKLDQISLNLIQIDQTCSNMFKLDQTCSNLIKMDQIGLNMIKIDQTYSN